MGGYTGVCIPLYELFRFSDFVLLDTKKIFCKCYQNHLRNLSLKLFRLVLGGFRAVPKESVQPFINNGVFFTDMVATACRLNTMHELKTLNLQSSSNFRITKSFEAFVTYSLRRQCRFIT